MSRGRFIALWLAAVVATSAAFVVHLSMRFQNVRLGYAVSSLRTKQRELLEVRRALEIEAETLRDPTRVERIAREALDMEVATPARIVPMGRTNNTERRTAGRIR